MQTLRGFRTKARGALPSVVCVLLAVLAGWTESFASQTNSSATPFWQPVPFPYKASVYCILVDSMGTMFVGTADSGIYRSTDKGNTWAWVTNGGSNNTGELTITSCIVSGSNGILYASLHGQVYQSNDDGITWKKLNIGNDVSYVRTIVVNAAGFLFAGGVGGIARSTDGGTSWSTVFHDETQEYSIAVNSRGFIYVGGRASELLRSTDNGSTWSHLTYVARIVGPTSYLYTPWVIVTDKRDNIYVGTDGGVFISTDLGNSWRWSDNGFPPVVLNGSPQNGLLPVFTNGLAQNGIGHLFAGTISGMYLSTDYADSWINFDSGLDSSLIQCVSAAPDGEIFVGTWGSGIFRSRQSTTMFDVDQRFMRIFTGITTNIVTDTLTVRNRSLDTLLITNVMSSDPSFSIAPSNSVIGPSDSESFLISSSASRTGVFSTDIFFATNSYLGPESLQVRLYSGVPFLELQERRVYCGNATIGGWKDTTLFLKNFGYDTLRIASISSIDSQFSVLSFPRVVLSGKKDSIVVRFRPVYGGFQSGDIMIESNSPESPDTIIVTGNGFYPVGVKNPLLIPQEFHLAQNFPNPFNPSTTIQYDIPKPAHVSIIVYDILGRQIETLLNGDELPGHYQVTFDGSRLPSGVYFYKIQASNYTATKKLLLLK